MAVIQVRHAALSPLIMPASSIDPTLFEKLPPKRCDSDRSTSSENELRSPLTALQTPVQFDEQSLKLLSEISQNQVRWDRVMCNELDLPEGYHSVAVLLVRWREDIDQFKSATTQEVHALETLFKKKFGYYTKVVDLSNECTCAQKCLCSPQHRFDRAVSRFMSKYDAEHNLTILYYTGHGSYVDKTETSSGFLRLHATNQTEEPSIAWDEAEQEFIRPAKGDVLTIMDACFAGNVKPTVRREYEGTYEYLGACHIDRTTASPGKKSFTTALIASLEQLLSRHEGNSFTTADLLRVITEHTRRNNPPWLASRIENNDRRISLAPKLPCKKSYFDESPIPAYLTLRIELKEQTLDPDKVEDLAKKIAWAVRQSKVDARRVDWLKLAPRRRSLKDVVRTVRTAIALGKLQPVQEEPPVIETPIHKPGIWATFGVFTPWKHFHTVTVSLERPWTRVVAASIGFAIVFGAYSHRRRMSPLTLLYLLMGKTQSLGKGLG